MTKTEPIRLLMGSDFHFGSPSNNSEDMARAFASTIFPLLPDTDLFFINGDFFDTLVIFDNHGFDPIYDTVMRLFALCDHHKVGLRILQGTWTHDRKQCLRFGAFYRNSGYTFDYKYVDGITLEEISIRDRSLRFLYVQDDLPYKSSDEIVEVINTKMTEMGWSDVDYACMHGFFEFTFPSGVKQEGHKVFRENQFPFVKKIVDVGHVHHYRASGKLISNGSFDRLCHGEEEPKGLIRLLDYPDHYTAQFIENKNAAIWDTLVFTKDDTTETIRARIGEHLAKITSDRIISLRFTIDTIDHRDAIKAWMKEVHPHISVKFKKSKEDEDKQALIPSSLLFAPVEKRVSPTPATIATFIRAHIPEDYPLTVDDIEGYLEPVLEKA